MSNLKALLSRLKENIKKTSFLGNFCVEKFSTLPVCFENKQSKIVPYDTL